MIALAVAAAALSAGWNAPIAGAAPTRPLLCTWGGTPAAPTGEFTISPGLTNLPSAGPLAFRATGVLGGGGECTGRVTFVGIIQPGATCSALVFEGRVKGLPGVARFYGPGIGGLVHEFLYDKHGNIVGADQPQALTQDEQHSRITDCATPEGFTHGRFSSVIELWA
jgi:hypothetical protein